MTFSTDNPVPDTMGTVYYDGTCKLCHGVIRFLLKRKSARLRYIVLQSEEGRQAQARIESPDSIIFEEDGIYYQESAAVLRILRQLKWPYRLIGGIIGLLPSVLIDRIYRFVAARRYKWFGQKDHCDLYP